MAAVGVLLSAPLHLIYNILPESWLQDYDFDPDSEDVRAARRMRFFPHSLILIPVIAALFFLGAYLNPSFFENRQVFFILLMFLPIFPFSLIVMSDKLNRIIPDQIVVFAGLLSVFGFVSDVLYKSMWFSEESPFYYAIINRILGALIGAGLLWLIGFLGSILTQKEAMGQGDIKFIFVCGLLSGAYGLIFVFFFSFIIGGIVAVPLLIRKRIRISRADQMIRESNNPAKTRKNLAREKQQIHFADDPDYIAFGPFLALGTACFLIFETLVHSYFTGTILVSLEYLF
jgi:prepilin signal peptidase PulO-like enzyme (type II secretory pathway)